MYKRVHMRVRGRERDHTISILDVEAINRAIVARINFPASGFACEVTRSHVCNSTILLSSITKPSNVYLQVTVLYRIPHLQPEFLKKKVSTLYNTTDNKHYIEQMQQSNYRYCISMFKVCLVTIFLGIISLSPLYKSTKETTNW